MKYDIYYFISSVPHPALIARLVSSCFIFEYSESPSNFLIPLVLSERTDEGMVCRRRLRMLSRWKFPLLWFVLCSVASSPLERNNVNLDVSSVSQINIKLTLFPRFFVSLLNPFNSSLVYTWRRQKRYGHYQIIDWGWQETAGGSRHPRALIGSGKPQDMCRSGEAMRGSWDNSMAARRQKE